MDKSQGVSMKCLAGKRNWKRGPWPNPRQHPRAIDPVANDRMADFRQVDPDLVRPAGFEPAGKLCGHTPNCSITS